MQQALLAPASPLRLSTPFECKAFPFSDQRLSSSHYLSNGDDLFYGYSSPSGPSLGLSSPSPLVTSSLSPSPAASVVDDGDEGAAANWATTDHRLHLARLALQYQEVADRYELCLSHLADAADEAAALRRENAELRVAYTDLARRLATISGKQSSAVAIADEIHRLRLGEQQATKERRAAAAEKLAVLPKSISIRSGGYLKMCQAAATPGGRNGKLRASNPANIGSQRVYVGMGGKKGEDQNEQLKGGLELEAYNQGMVKTELCNKWEETGSCPFGDQCQFAHGVAELRPVIRHPRYKTAVCRMVLAGGACPYGHRCHFRHSLTPSDRLLLRP